MRGHHCEKDIGTKVAAFANYMGTPNPNQENPNLTTENVELLTKFATFLQQQKHEKHMHGHKGGQCHGKFRKHGHHGMFGHHFGRHGSYRKYEHGHGMHGHGPGKHGHGHGKHGHGHGNHGKHGLEFGYHFEHEKHFGKHHKMGKHYWRQFAMFNEANPNQTIVIEDSGCVETVRNPSPPGQVNDTVTQVPEGSSEVNNMKCVGESKGRHRGRRSRGHEWDVISRSAVDEASSQNETNQLLQDRLAAMVENVSIENSPPKE